MIRRQPCRAIDWRKCPDVVPDVGAQADLTENQSLINPLQTDVAAAYYIKADWLDKQPFKTNQIFECYCSRSQKSEQWSPQIQYGVELNRRVPARRIGPAHRARFRSIRARQRSKRSSRGPEQSALLNTEGVPDAYS